MFGIKEPQPYWPPETLHSLVTSPLKLLLGSLYHLTTVLQPSAGPIPDPIRLVCIADTHDRTLQVPDGDILIHAGDLTNDGTPVDIQAQIDWLDTQPHTHKICVAGNHDYFLDSEAYSHLPDAEKPAGSLDWKSVTYLERGATRLEFRHTKRTLNVYGAPQIPLCGPRFFAFQYPVGRDEWSNTIPDDVDVLVTHTPPKHHLDSAPVPMGCGLLLREIWRVKPLVHVFGHLHAARGTEVVTWDGAQRAYEEGAERARPGFLGQVLNLRLWFLIARVLGSGISGLVWRYVSGSRPRTCRMVNAAVVDVEKRLVHGAVVFDI